MSGKLKVWSSFKNLPNVKKFLYQTPEGSSEQDAGYNWDSDWGWEDVEIDDEDSETDISGWLVETHISVSSTGEIMVLARGKKLVILTYTFDEDSANPIPVMKMKFSGEPAYMYEADVITSVLCVPLNSQRQSNHGAPDWTCVIVGFSTGYVRFYSDNGGEILSQRLHDQPVKRFRLRTYEPSTRSNSPEQAEELTVLFDDVLVCIEGFSLYQSLRACRSHLARVSAGSSSTFDSPPLSFKKWALKNQDSINDHASLGLRTANPFEHLVTASLLGGPYANIQSTAPTHTVYATSGRSPFLGLYYAAEGAWQPMLTDVARLVATKVKTAIFSAAASWLGSRTATHSTSGSSEDPQRIEPATSVTMRYGLPDKRRESYVMEIAPDRRLCAMVDSFGRVLLIDLHRGVTLRMWKGYRDGQVAWLEREDDAARIKTAPRRVMFLIIYAPRRGILEVWAVEQGPRVAAFNVGKGGRLVAVDYTMLGLNSTTYRSLMKHCKTQPLHSAFFLDRDGHISTVDVPFHLCLTDRSSYRTHDYHLLKLLRTLMREKACSTPDDALLEAIFNILNQFKLVGFLEQATERILSTKFITAYILETLFKEIIQKLETDDLCKMSPKHDKQRLILYGRTALNLIKTYTSIYNFSFQEEVSDASMTDLKALGEQKKFVEKVIEVEKSLTDVVKRTKSLEKELEVVVEGARVLEQTQEELVAGACSQEMEVDGEEEKEKKAKALEKNLEASLKGAEALMKEQSESVKEARALVHEQAKVLEEHTAKQEAESNIDLIITTVKPHLPESWDERIDRLAKLLKYNITGRQYRSEITHRELGPKTLTVIEFLAMFYSHFHGRKDHGGLQCDLRLSTHLSDQQKISLGEFLFRSCLSGHTSGDDVISALLSSCIPREAVLSAFVTYYLSKDRHWVPHLNTLVSLLQLIIHFKAPESIATSEEISQLIEYVEKEIKACKRLGSPLFLTIAVVSVLQSEIKSREKLNQETLTILPSLLPPWMHLCRRTEDCLSLQLLLAHRPVSEDPLLSASDNASSKSGLSAGRAADGLPDLSVSQTRLSEGGRGFVTELVARWMTRWRLTLADLQFLYLSLTESQDEAASSHDSTSIMLPYMSQPNTQDLFAVLYDHFPMALEMDSVLANVAWEYIYLWSTDVEEICLLSAAIDCLGHLGPGGALICHGVASMAWHMHIEKFVQCTTYLIEKVGGKVPKDRLCRKDANMSQACLRQFVHLVYNFMEIFKKANCDADVVPAFMMDESWRDGVDGRLSLVELAIDQPVTNYGLLVHHSQLLFCLDAILTFDIRGIKPYSLFNTRGVNTFFKSMTSHPLLSDAQNADVPIVNQRTLFINQVLKAAVQLLKENDAEHVHNHFRDKIVGSLSQEFGMDEDIARRQHIVYLYSYGLDDRAEAYFTSVTDTTVMASQLLLVAGQRCAHMIFPVNDSINLKRIGLMPPVLQTYLKTSNYEELPCTDVPLQLTKRLIEFVIHLMTDDHPELHRARLINDMIERFINLGEGV